LASTVKKATYGVSVNPAMQFVPDSATDLTSTNSLLYSIYVNNISSGAVTFTVKDKQATPMEIIPALSIGADSAVFFEWNDGIVCPGGINWIASAASALSAAVTATYKVAS